MNVFTIHTNFVFKFTSFERQFSFHTYFKGIIFGRKSTFSIFPSANISCQMILHFFRGQFLFTECLNHFLFRYFSVEKKYSIKLIILFNAYCIRTSIKDYHLNSFL